ncbi:hypothetical protein [Anabaena sp. CCY 9613]
MSLNFARVGGLDATVGDAVATVCTQEVKSRLLLSYQLSVNSY